jgi:hypothetical protein
LPPAGRSGGGTTTVAGSAPRTPRGAAARGYDGAATLTRSGSGSRKHGDAAMRLADDLGSHAARLRQGKDAA